MDFKFLQLYRCPDNVLHKFMNMQELLNIMEHGYEGIIRENSNISDKIRKAYSDAIRVVMREISSELSENTIPLGIYPERFLDNFSSVTPITTKYHAIFSEDIHAFYKQIDEDIEDVEYRDCMRDVLNEVLDETERTEILYGILIVF